MPGAERAEIYFITAMMLLILIVSFTAVYFFFKQYRKETRERELRREKKTADKLRAEINDASEDPRQ